MVPFLYHLFHMWRMIENWKMPQNKISHVAFCRSRGFTELWAFYGSRLFDFIIANSHKAVSLLVHYWQFHRKGDKSIHIYNLYLFFTLLLDRKNGGTMVTAAVTSVRDFRTYTLSLKSLSGLSTVCYKPTLITGGTGWAGGGPWL